MIHEAGSSRKLYNIACGIIATQWRMYRNWECIIILLLLILL